MVKSLVALFLIGLVFLLGTGNRVRGAAAPTGPKTLAVGGVKVGKVLLQDVSNADKGASIGRVAQAMDGQLMDSFNATRKFQLLARSDLANLIEEQGVKKSGEVLGAQYLLTVSIDDFQDATKSAKVDTAGTIVDVRTVRLTAVVKIYDAADGKVLDVTSQVVELNDRSMTAANIKDDGKLSDRLLGAIAHEASFRAANRVIDVIYPARVVSRTGQEVTINRGDGTTVAVGQKWIVRGAEKIETDPDTGATVKVPGPVLGRVTVSQITPLLSICLVDNEVAPGQISQGDLLLLDTNQNVAVPNVVAPVAAPVVRTPVSTAAPVASGLKKIGIAPVRAGNTLLASIKAEGKESSMGRVCDAMDSQLLDGFQGTRKFTVVARSDLDSLLKESNLTISGLTEAPKDLRVKNLDYMLVITVDHFQDHAERIEYQTTGAAVIRIVTFTAVGKLYDVVTGELKESTNIDVSQRAPFDAGSISSQDNKLSDTLMLTCAREMAHRVANRVTDVIFPTKVLARTGSQVTLDRGDGTDVQVGQVFTAFKVGKELKDETGQSLGFEEFPVGNVRISSVLPKTSKAEVLQESALNEISEGCILRFSAPAAPK